MFGYQSRRSTGLWQSWHTHPSRSNISRAANSSKMGAARRLALDVSDHRSLAARYSGSVAVRNRSHRTCQAVSASRRHLGEQQLFPLTGSNTSPHCKHSLNRCTPRACRDAQRELQNLVSVSFSQYGHGCSSLGGDFLCRVRPVPCDTLTTVGSPCRKNLVLCIQHQRSGFSAAGLAQPSTRHSPKHLALHSGEQYIRRGWNTNGPPHPKQTWPRFPSTFMAGPSLSQDQMLRTVRHPYRQSTST